MSTVIRWLHLSDFHFNLDQSYDATVVLDALLRDLPSLAQPEFVPIDLIFVTGDIAHSGDKREYELAARFLEELLFKLGTPKDKLYVVPGNHDVARQHVGMAAAIDAYVNNPALSPTEARARVAELLNDRQARALVLRRLSGYSDFVNAYFANHLSFTDKDFFYSRAIRMGDVELAVYGLNSGWFCSSDSDQNQLLIGERQVRDAIKQKGNAAVRIALLHHPFEWLVEYDRYDSEELLIQNCDFILHGHRHKQSFRQDIRPNGRPYIFASGPGYDKRSLPNACNLVKIDLPAGRGAALSLRYSDEKGGFWARDTLSDPGLQMGIFKFDLGHPYASEVPLGALDPESRKRLLASPFDYTEYVKKTGQLYAVSTDDLLEVAVLSPADAVSLLRWLVTQNPSFVKDLVVKAGSKLGQALSRSPADLSQFVDLRNQLMHAVKISDGAKQGPALLALETPGGTLSREVVLQIPRKDPSQPLRAEQLSFSICLTSQQSRPTENPEIRLSTAATFLSYQYRGGGFTIEPSEHWGVSKPDAATVRCLYHVPQGIEKDIPGLKNPVIGTVRMLIPWGEADNRPINLDFVYEIEYASSGISRGAFKIKIVPALAFEMAPEARRFIVPANEREGVDTGLYIHRGQMLRFAAEGVVSLDSGNHFVNANGYMCDKLGHLYQPTPDSLEQYASPGELLKGQRAGVLLGWLGDWRDGQAFYVGSTNTIVAESEGSLHLAVNDLLNAYGDNSGAFTALVRVE